MVASTILTHDASQLPTELTSHVADNLAGSSLTRLSFQVLKHLFLTEERPEGQGRYGAQTEVRRGKESHRRVAGRTK